MAEHPALRGLYPFLHGSARDADALQRSLLGSVHWKAQDSAATEQRCFAAHGRAVVAAAEAIAGVYRRQGRMFSMGNGGSRCDAAHFAAGFTHKVTTGRPAPTAVNLAGGMAMVTAVGNDIGIGHIFLRPLIALARRRGGLTGFSTGGSSETIMAAFATAKAMGVLTIGLTGHDGGKMARSTDLDHCLVVPGDSIHRIQETHMATYHILWDLVHSLLAEDYGGAMDHPA